jgi:hypothetical protein
MVLPTLHRQIVSRCAKPDQTTMTEYSADGLIARLTPGVIDRFQGRGAIDFRVLQGEPRKLHVSILFSRGLDPREALDDLKSLAEQAGLWVANEEATEHSVSITIPVPRQVPDAVGPRGVVLWVVPEAAVAMADVFREPAYAGISHDHRRAVHSLLRRVPAALARWRSLFLPSKPLQPAGAK